MKIKPIILMNILESLSVGLIDVRVFDDVERFNLEIKDSGPGISEEGRPFIFDPFFTTKAVGLGMGPYRAKG